MSTDGHSRDEPGAVSRFMQSRTSMNVSSPSAIRRPAARSLPMPPPIPASQPSRISTTTRSSSPVSSSDVASSKYFHQTTGSGRSSTSSYGEESAHPPVPVPTHNVVLGKHIVPPKDLYKLDLSQLQSGSPDEKRRLSNPWPLFSTVSPINAFTSRRPKPPGKPRVVEMLSSLEPTPPSRRSLGDVTVARSSTLRGTNAVSTARRKWMEQRSASVPRQEPLTFRDMSQKAAKVLTDKEKADRWDDLLERSDRAGGTIRLDIRRRPRSC
ncbi:hypothetical protein C8R45DRAFT_1042503 [Mycena sanguinolenta]|nr:hypothetical protein C8R45DRAFT_1042503 [Mycena sanguinolenta]